MIKSADIWRQYYQQALARPHAKRTEFAVRLNVSGCEVAVDCGCGTGSDIQYLHQRGYAVYGFDSNGDAIDICKQRFKDNPLVEITESSFETFSYPAAGVVIANSSLYFAAPRQFASTWSNISSSILTGGVFAGDFMGHKDSWANNYRTQTTPLSEAQVMALFSGFEIIRFHERDDDALTSLGKMKHWHTYSVVAVKKS